jgi:TonB family protein
VEGFSAMRRLLISFVFVLLSLASVAAESTSPVGRQPLPKALYAPTPVYRPEWARQGLAGKGLVLVTIDPRTGKVTNTRMLTSTGNQQLDRAALEAYSRWRFQPGGVPQIKIPIEFAAARARPQPPRRTLPQPLLIALLLGAAIALMAVLRKNRA